MSHGHPRSTSGSSWSPCSSRAGCPTSPAALRTGWTRSRCNGCQTVQTAGGEQLTGECIARNAADHATAGSPLADYSLFGGDGTVGPAGIIGVLVTLAVAGGLFWLLRRRGTRP